MSAVVDVGDALELTFAANPGATVLVSWLDPNLTPLVDLEEVTESPDGSGRYPYTFVASSPGVWTARFTASGTSTAVEAYYVRAKSVDGPPPLAAVGDVAAQYGSMSAAQESLAGWLLRAASQMIRANNKLVDAQIADGTLNPDLVALAATNMVLRVLRNPRGLRAETTGPFSLTYDTTVAAGLLVLTDAEEVLLSPTLEADRPAVGQFRPRPTLAIAPIRQRGGWPDGWW